MNNTLRAYEGKEPYYFVSYSHNDRLVVLPILQELHNMKYRIWYDEGIAPGSEWPENIERHLTNASGVLVFISSHSLTSQNCENEVVVSVRQNKPILAVNIEQDNYHPLLSDVKYFSLDGNLVQTLIDSGQLSDEYLGDGIHGYEYVIENKNTFNKWNLMLGFAVLLVLFVSTSLYGLYQGWFDSYLPAKQLTLKIEPETYIKEESISASENLIGSVLPVDFISELERIAIYQKLNWQNTNIMTYGDLIEMVDINRLDLFKNDQFTDLTFVTFLPNLQILSIHDWMGTDLTPLINCNQLQTVEVTVKVLPLLIIPEKRNFEVLLIP